MTQYLNYTIKSWSKKWKMGRMESYNVEGANRKREEDRRKNTEIKYRLHVPLPPSLPCKENNADLAYRLFPT